MKDRFKYRAWDKENKKYIYDVEKGLQFYSTAGNLRVLTLAEVAESSKYVLEQCTGCMDCANQLIYEGDILEIMEDMGVSHVAVYWDDEFQKRAIQGDTEADYEFYDLVRRPCDTDGAIDDIGIVGNIHENPELLEEDK